VPGTCSDTCAVDLVASAEGEWKRDNTAVVGRELSTCSKTRLDIANHELPLPVLFALNDMIMIITVLSIHLPELTVVLRPTCAAAPVRPAMPA
jgi:hypothetical protein